MSQTTQAEGPLRIAGVQLDITWEEPETNFSKAAALAARAARAGAQLVVLPEMFATGFSMDTAKVVPFAHQTRAFLGELAERHAIWLLGGYAEAGPEGRARNACSLMTPDGSELLRYHKIHPFSLAGEHECFEGGVVLPTTSILGVRITPLICYDLRFPEPFRAAARRTDLYLVIANWPDKRVHAWSTLLAARAIENQAYVLGVNRVGAGGGLTYSGCSAIFDPLGQPITSIAHQEGIVAGTVNAAEVARIRRELPFLDDQRSEVYREL